VIFAFRWGINHLRIFSSIGSKYILMHLEPQNTAALSPIMVVDDNVSTLTLLRRILERSGFQNICCFTDGEEALEALKIFEPYMVILDLDMPYMTGYQFLTKVQEANCLTTHCPILVYTATDSAEAKLKALELGASDFLTKPANPVEIQNRVGKFLRMRQLQLDLEAQRARA
jgi:DNA-binding response OmpR family regulator